MAKWIVYILGDGILAEHSRIRIAIVKLGDDLAFIHLLLACLFLLQTGQQRRFHHRMICEYRGPVAHPEAIHISAS